ncbi:hypothetical protein pb186bvf_008403 [Paramecium bursaria]
MQYRPLRQQLYYSPRQPVQLIVSPPKQVSDFRYKSPKTVNGPFQQVKPLGNKDENREIKPEYDNTTLVSLIKENQDLKAQIQELETRLFNIQTQIQQNEKL